MEDKFEGLFIWLKSELIKNRKIMKSSTTVSLNHKDVNSNYLRVIFENLPHPGAWLLHILWEFYFHHLKNRYKRINEIFWRKTNLKGKTPKDEDPPSRLTVVQNKTQYL